MSDMIAQGRMAGWRMTTVGALVALVLAGVAAPTEVANAAKGGSCAAFTVVVDGQSFTGNQKRDIQPGAGQTATIDGTYVEFTVDLDTFSVFNYTLTGVDSPRADKNLPIDGPTVVYVSKVPNHSDTLNGPLTITIGNEGVVLERSGVVQSMKIQAKDCAQGGLFQMEPEPGVTETNTLGPEFTYTGQPAGQTRLCFTNGRWSGYDSPELATLVSFTPKTAVWDVQSGGRVGMVIGEDAVEGGCNP